MTIKLKSPLLDSVPRSPLVRVCCVCELLVTTMKRKQGEKRRWRSPDIGSRRVKPVELFADEVLSPPSDSPKLRNASTKKVKLHDVDIEPMIVLNVGQTPEQETVWVSPAATKGFRFSRILGSGTSGTVYEAFPPGKSTHRGGVAIKVQKADDESFADETRLARQMSKLGVGPRVLDSWEADGVGFLVTDQWDMSLWDYFHKQKQLGIVPSLPPHLVFKLEVLIRRLHEAGIVHGDILEKNILVRTAPTADLKRSEGVNPPAVDIVLTDFGLAHSISKWRSMPNFLQTMLDYQADPVNHSHYYFKDKQIELADLVRDPRHLDRSLLYYFKNYTSP